jgi:puromycin-sensitive aminopeptidase
VPVQIRVIGGRGSGDGGSGEGEARVQRFLLGEAEARLAVPGDFRAAVVNEGGHGFYRVWYAPRLLRAVLGLLPEGLSAIERFNLVNDCWAMVLAGLMPLADYLKLTARFRDERDKNVWAVLSGSLHTLNRLIAAEEDRPGLAALVRDRAGQAAAELGWAPRLDLGESELTQQLRGDLLRLLGTLGEDRGVQARAAEVYDEALRNPQAAEPNVLAAVVAILAHCGDEARYAEFLARFRAARTPQEEQRYLYALAGFRPPPLVRQTLERTLGGDIRKQDAPFVVRSLLWSIHGRCLAWAFFKENWERMNREFPVTGVRRLCEGVTGLTTAEWESEVHEFFRSRQVDLGGKTLEQYLEQLRIAVSLRQREGVVLREYLRR